MSALRAGLLLALTACGRGPPQFELHMHDRGPDLVFTGEAVWLTFFVTTPGGDARDLSLPETPDCLVTAPSGLAVECTFSAWSRPSIDEDNGVAQMWFTPKEAGWHEVKAILHEGGEVALRVYSVARRRDVLATLPLPCAWVERLPGGAWLCDDVVLRGDESPQSLGAELATSGGSAIWTFNAGEVRRFRDSGSGAVTPEPAARLDTRRFFAHTLLASESEAILVDDEGLVRIGLDAGGALREVARAALLSPGRAIVNRVGSVVMTGVVVAEESEVCLFTMDPGALSAGACRRYPGRLLGAADGGLWLISGARLRLVSPVLDEGLEVELPGPLSSGVNASPRGFAVLPGGAVPRVDAGSVQYQSFASAAAASETLVWSRTQLSTTVMAR